MRLVSCPLFSLLPTSLSVPPRPKPCVSCFVAADAALFFPFFLTLSKGVDCSSWDIPSLLLGEPPPCFVGGPTVGCFFPPPLPTSFLCHGPSPLTGEVKHQVGRTVVLSLGLPYLSQLWPCLAACPPPSWGTELRGRCFRGENKWRGVAGIKRHLHSLPPVLHVHNSSPLGSRIKDPNQSLRALLGQGEPGAVIDKLAKDSRKRSLCN